MYWPQTDLLGARSSSSGRSSGNDLLVSLVLLNNGLLGDGNRRSGGLAVTLGLDYGLDLVLGHSGLDGFAVGLHDRRDCGGGNGLSRLCVSQVGRLYTGPRQDG